MFQDALGQHLWLVMHQTTKLVASEPRKVVTALRIIEREERYAVGQDCDCGFI